ncbi:Hok/Gef family protein [Pseudocitrobacter cyperus]|uniref:Hok/Gef family protein n=1 Tax=Pseudocitrobacter cyperus TaxID=3112843 RepID=UPI00398C6C3B
MKIISVGNYAVESKITEASGALCLMLRYLIFTYLTRSPLYELRIRDEHREVAAFLACESGQSLTGGGKFSPPFSVQIKSG